MTNFAPFIRGPIVMKSQDIEDCISALGFFISNYEYNAPQTKRDMERLKLRLQRIISGNPKQKGRQS